MKNLPRPVVFISAATAFSLLGDQFLYAVLPSYYDELGLLPIHVGILLSVNRWVRFLTNPLAEWAYRRWSIGPLVALMFALGSVLTVIYGTVASFPVLLGARMAWGLCWSFIRQAGNMTVVDSAHAQHIGRHMGLYNGISRLGSLAGMVLGGVGHDLFGFSATLLAFAAVSLAASPFGYLSRRSMAHKTESPRSGIGLRKNVGLMVSGLVLGLVGSGMIISTLGYLLEARAGSIISLWGVSIGVATLTGLVLGIRWASDLVAAPFLGAVSDRIGRKRSSLIFFGVGGVALLLVVPTSEVLALVGGVVVFFVCTTALQVLLTAEAGMRGSGAVVGYVSAADMGAAAGPFMAWSALQVALPRESVLVAGGACYLIGAALAFRTFRDAHAEAHVAGIAEKLPE